MDLQMVLNLEYITLHYITLHYLGTNICWRKYHKATLYTIKHYQQWYKTFHLAISQSITGIRKSNKRPDCNAMHQYFKKKLEINLTEDDIANKISFLLEKNFLSNKMYIQRRFILLYRKR